MKTIIVENIHAEVYELEEKLNEIAMTHKEHYRILQTVISEERCSSSF